MGGDEHSAYAKTFGRILRGELFPRYRRLGHGMGGRLYGLREKGEWEKQEELGEEQMLHAEGMRGA